MSNFLLFLLIPCHVILSSELKTVNNNNYLSNGLSLPSSSLSLPTAAPIKILYNKKQITENNLCKNISKKVSCNRFRRNTEDEPPSKYFLKNQDKITSLDRNYYIDEQRKNNYRNPSLPNIRKFPNSDEILPRDRKQQLSQPLSSEFAGLQIWNGINLLGRREAPMLVDEPIYISVRRNGKESADLIVNRNQDLFIPPRGRKNQYKKRYDTENVFDVKDLFVPNRGKKINEQISPYLSSQSGLSTPSFKREKYSDIFSPNDLFFPNRGKKELNFLKKSKQLEKLLDDNDVFYPTHGKKSESYYNFNNDVTDPDLFFPNRGKRNTLIKNFEMRSKNDGNDGKERFRRDVLDNLSKEKDTFYSARGRRIDENNKLNEIIDDEKINNVIAKHLKDENQIKNLKKYTNNNNDGDRHNFIRNVATKYGSQDEQEPQQVDSKYGHALTSAVDNFFDDNNNSADFYSNIINDAINNNFVENLPIFRLPSNNNDNNYLYGE